jgi:O-antigen ligase
LYALHTIRAHPWLGDYASYAPGFYSHNVLSAWVDLGLFGIVYLMALMVVPAAIMFGREYFAGRRNGLFLLGFVFACVDLLLLIESHYFADMLVGATLGACSSYFYQRKYASHRPFDLRPPAPRQPDLRQAVPHLGRARP